MAELTITTFLSADGIMQAPGGPNEDQSGGFQHGGWVVPYVDEGFGEFMDSVFQKPAAFLLGRITYQIFANHWPRVPPEEELVSRKLNSLPKYVASRTLRSVDWHGSKLLGSDVVAEIKQLKASLQGELQVHGSAGLAQTLIEHDLIDEYRLLTFPAVLGSGKRLFGSGARPKALKLASSKTTSRGVVITTYRRGGALETGSFQLPEK